MILGLALTALLARGDPARALPPGFSVRAVYANAGLPAAIRFSPTGRLFVLEYSTGRVLVYPSPPDTAHFVWATIPLGHGVDEGMTGIEFHPDYPDSPFVYLFHANPSPEVHRLVRLRDLGNSGTGYAVLFDGLSAGGSVHHGGRLAFGPDRMLRVTFGDTDHPPYAQIRDSTQGKIFRLDPMGRIPADNPFGPTNPAVVMGVRNSFGIAFDPASGAGYFTDNGSFCDDEVNLLVSGANYGWGPSDPCGSQPAGTTLPILNFANSIAPTGCCVYRGQAFPQFDGNLFFGSYVDRAVRRVVLNPSNPAVVESVEVFVSWPPVSGQPPENVLDVTVGRDGRLWVSTNDTIWLIEGPPPVSSGPSIVGSRLEVAPNPFLDMARVRIPTGMTLDRLEILDASGRRLREWNGPLSGVISWNGRDRDGRDVPAGVYWIRALGSGRVAVKRIARLRP